MTAALLLIALAQPSSDYELFQMRGWTVSVRSEVFEGQAADWKTAKKLLDAQLEEIVRVVPPDAVAKLRMVKLWVSPEYPGIQPRAEYHPGAQWLRDNKRDPQMAKGIEITNVRIFEAETRRMPNFALHELAHAYHDQFLPKGFENPGIKSAFEVARAGKRYDKVKRRDSEGRERDDKAYAMTNQMEFFAESSEAYFTTNDFFPFNRKELLEFDPATAEAIRKAWGAPIAN